MDSSRDKSTTWQRNLTIPLIFNVIPLILTLISLIFNADSDEGLADGLNGPANHAAIVRNLERTLPEAARAGISNVITFVGNRRGMAAAEGIDYCVIGLSRLAPVAENESVTIVVEVANSRVDHRDYHGDHIAFGVEVVERVTSPRVKLVYDVYDMQIIEGVIIRTIQANHASIGLYHTGGVPDDANSIVARRSTGVPLPPPSSKPGSPATWRTSSCRPATRSRRSGTRSDSATCSATRCPPKLWRRRATAWRSRPAHPAARTSESCRSPSSAASR